MRGRGRGVDEGAGEVVVVSIVDRCLHKQLESGWIAVDLLHPALDVYKKSNI